MVKHKDRRVALYLRVSTSESYRSYPYVRGFHPAPQPPPNQCYEDAGSEATYHAGSADAHTASRATTWCMKTFGSKHGLGGVSDGKKTSTVV